MSFQKTHDNYRNGDCVHKRSCRYILQGLLDDLELNQLYSLTLPSTNFELEKRLWQKYEYSYMQMCEINPKVFAQQEVIAMENFIFPNAHPWEKMLKLHNEDVCKLQSTSPFNFVWMDMCGYFTQAFFESMCTFLRANEFRSKGVFAITLLSSRENRQSQAFCRKLQLENLGTQFTTLNNFRSIQLPKIFVNVLSEYFPSLTFGLTAKYSYKPSSGGNTMTMYAFSWEST